MATILQGGTKTHLADKPFALFSLNLDFLLYLREAEPCFFSANRLLVHDVSDQIELRATGVGKYLQALDCLRGLIALMDF